MKLRIEIDMNNSAFDGGDNGTEAARILRELAGRLDGETMTAPYTRPLLDINGNRVGTAKNVR